LLALRDAFGGGGLPLLLVTAENLFGVTIDGYLQLSERDARVVMEELGPLEVDVPGDVRVPAGGDTVRVVLSEGPQLLGPEALTTLLYTAGLEPDDVELGGRHLAFWDALFDTYSDEPGALIEAVSAAGGALGKSDLSPEAIAERVADLATMPVSSRTLRSLPVTPLEVAGARLYVPDDEEIGDFGAAVLGTAALSEQIKVQILNGNGAPGIGQEVAQRLVGQGFRVILSGNASRLDHETTLVIAYEDSAEARALAQRARDLLGVGEVRVSTQEQGIVDLTIVVGKDFLRSQ
jgi:hypothetical protein